MAGSAAATAPLRIGVTVGDAAGIGPEVLALALQQTRLCERASVRLYATPLVLDWLRRGPWQACRLLDEGLLQAVAVVVAHAGPPPVLAAGQPCAVGRQHAFAALDAMASDAAAGHLEAMVTGPVPKGIFDHLDPRPPGQTEFLAQRLGATRFAMMLAGPQLRVVPVTTHVPLRAVASLLTVDSIVGTAQAAAAALRDWFGLPAPRLAVCGLNPHAGEDGRLGDEEARLIAPAVSALRAAGVEAQGPVVADSAFFHAMQGRFDAVICMYHDQALGPLKTVHFYDAVNLTCGLPVPRLSPDHGTAYDIAGRGLADPSSMVQALQMALALGERSQASGPHFNQRTTP